MSPSHSFLTPAQVRQFLAHGHVAVTGCFSRETAQAWTARTYARLGYDPDRRATWKRSRVHLPPTTRVRLQEFAPKAWGVACELLGGEARVRPTAAIDDGFIINFREGAGRPWQPPSAKTPGWHTDGDYFRHFLDSPEQGLVALILWSNVESRGGGTFLAADSVPAVARYLAAHPEGILPRDIDYAPLIAGCREFVEVTGEAGTIVFLHPFLLHAASQNHSPHPRFLTNPPIALKRPMIFSRRDAGEYSLVEQAVLQGLGVERLEFLPTARRQRIVPPRVHAQRRMRRQQAARIRRLHPQT